MRPVLIVVLWLWECVIVSSADHAAGESFRDLVLQLRGRTGLTQRELATRTGVHARSIQGWEVGTSYPGVASLKALIAAALQAGGFTPAREAEEARALWAAALRDAPRFRTPFDGVWFQQIAAGRRETVQEDDEPSVAALAAPHLTIGSERRESWGEAPDIAGFLNRVSERALLSQWVLDEGSRLVTVLGLGGIGKSLLATRLAHDLAPSFECVYWRSLRDAPTPGEWLAEALTFLAPDAVPEPGGEAALLRRLLELLRETRCLLVLDNVETVLQPGGPVGGYRAGYERYGTLLRQVAEASHRSCLVVTSREEPAELGPLLGERGPVRALELAGFGTEDGRALLSDKQLDGSEDEWQALVGRYGGNGLALKVVGETTRELFGGSIAEYLEYAAETSGVMVGGVRQLLGAQVQRLSDLEVELLRRLAIEREPVGLAELAADLSPRIGRGAVLAAVEGLRRRSLLERTVRGPLFGLHSVVLEYVTEQLIEDVAQELVHGELDVLLRQPLLKATGKDYLRRSQERLIVAPLLELLVEARGSARMAEQRLVSLLDKQRGQTVEDQGYGPGNLVNLLRLLRGDLKGADLSRLAIRQAYLQEVEAHGASLAESRLSETVLGEAFSNPMSLALSPDGAYLAAGTASGEVCHWRVADRTLLATMPGHAGQVMGVAVSGDGRLVVSGGGDGSIRLWEADSDRPPSTLRGHTDIVRGVALSADGRVVASGSLDGTVRLWTVESGLPIAVLRGHTERVYAVALSGDGRLVACSGVDGAVRLWDPRSERPLATLDAHAGGILGVALSGDGRLVAGGGFDGTVRLWDARSERLLAALHGHSGLVMAVSMSGDGRLIASSGADGTVRLWEGETGQLRATEDRRPLATLHGHSSVVVSVALSRDGRLVASGSLDGTIRLWEAESGLPLAALQGHTGGILTAALSGDGRLAASGAVDGTVRIWEAESGRPHSILHGHTGSVRGVALSGDGRLLASGGIDEAIRLWDVGSGKPLTVMHARTGGVRGVALSRDGLLVASANFDGTIRLWETESGRPLATLEGHRGGALSVALSRDGRLLSSGGIDGTVRLWDVASGRSLAVLRGHVAGVWSVSFAGGGRFIASGGDDMTIRLWEVASGRPLATLRGHTDAVRGVALSDDGRLVLSGSLDETVRIWEAASGRLLATLAGNRGGIWGLALSDDGDLAANGGVDGMVMLWDVDNGVLRHALRAERRFEALDITGLTGVTDAQRSTLFALGAIEPSKTTSPAG